MISKVNGNLPVSTKISDVNDMVIEVNGKTEQGQFDKNELDQIFIDMGIDRKYLRNQLLGNTHTDYLNWTHYYAESGYSIWKYTPFYYKHNINNKLYMDDKVLDFRGEATAENSTFDKLFDYIGSVYGDDTIAAGLGNTTFTGISAITDYQYLGSSNVFNGVDFTFSVKGNNYTMKFEYWDGYSWNELTTVDDLTDNTNDWTTDGTIVWDVPSTWARSSVNSSAPYFYIRISTTTVPVTTAIFVSIKPTTSIRSLLSLTSTDFFDEKWSWCSYAGSIYVTIRNTGQTAYEGSYHITSASSVTNLQNYFVHNHEFKADYENSSFTGTSINIESGVSFGDLVYISDEYTFNSADADIWRRRCMGVFVSPGYVKMTTGLVQNVNTVGSGNIVPGDVLYLSQTPGKVSRTCPPNGGTIIHQRVGIAISYENSGNVVDMIFNPEYI